jgi:hypothetical protein
VFSTHGGLDADEPDPNTYVTNVTHAHDANDSNDFNLAWRCCDLFESADGAFESLLPSPDEWCRGGHACAGAPAAAAAAAAHA